MKIPTRSYGKTQELKHVYDKMNVHVRGLESVGVDPESYGSLLIPIIMARVPQDVSLRIAKLTSQEVWEIQAVLEIIRKEVEARVLSDNVKIQKAKSTSRNKPKNGNHGNKDSTSTASCPLSKRPKTTAVLVL